MTIGLTKLRKAAADFKEAIAILAEEVKNPDLIEVVKPEAREIIQDLGDTIEGDVSEICWIPPMVTEPGEGDIKPQESAAGAVVDDPKEDYAGNPIPEPVKVDSANSDENDEGLSPVSVAE